METIPKPKTYGPLGNLPLIDRQKPVQSIMKIADELGPIFQFQFGSRNQIFISGPDLVEDASDQSRFDKKLSNVLQNAREVAGDGLFTSATDEPNWKKAHNILLPSFSQSAMRGYHSMMLDIAIQLIQKWQRMNADDVVNVPKDMTDLTLDTIGLCGFNYRFNSFYREKEHPFIRSMVSGLEEIMSRVQRVPIQDKLMLISKLQFNNDKQTMYSLVDKIISERRASGQTDEEDLLAHMLNGVDPETGEKLDDENIRFQIITFLIAGHETTSGALSFAIYYLLKNPDILKKAYEEVDRVLTDPLPSYTQVRELKYIRMILNETLRIWPTAPAFSLFAKEDTLLAGKYPMSKGTSVTVLIPTLHRNTEVWGEDALLFRPERFEDPSKIPHHAYKPFGNGQRACIGQQFALHEATLVLGMLLKHFEIIDYKNYQLEIKESLTLKPDNFEIKVKPRESFSYGSFSNSPTNVMEPTVKPEATRATYRSIKNHNTPLLILYGSNMGTCEGIARELTESAKLKGFQSTVKSLNEVVGDLPTKGAVLIVTSSYNGKPPENALEFVKWLEKMESDHLDSLQYAVFGCGDTNWAGTYQSVPILIDKLMEKVGGKRFVTLGEADASGDFELQVEDWIQEMWSGLFKTFNLQEKPTSDKLLSETSSLSIKFSSGHTASPITSNYNASSMKIVANKELHGVESDRSTRHIEIELPKDTIYQEGDHLGVIPVNNTNLVERVLNRYGLNGDDHIEISASGRSVAHLPIGRQVPVKELLSQCVELQEAVTRAQLRELSSFTVCPPHKKELEALLEDDAYREEVVNKRISMLDLLERYLACEMPFARFLELLPPLKPRYYSISSSPSLLNDKLSITVGVVRAPARSGNGEYRGVASNYLADRQIGDMIMAFIRTPGSGFTLPKNSTTPIVMVGPGTGFAPFRGFLQARQVMLDNGTQLGEAHLYVGCRDESEYIYHEEINHYEEQGIVKVHTAFSRKRNLPKTYVQHLMQEDAEKIIRIMDNNGKLYVCGDGSKMSLDVETCLVREYQRIHGVTVEESLAWLKSLQDEERYVKDVWVSK